MYWNAKYEDTKSEELLKLCSLYRRNLGLTKVTKYSVVTMLLDSLYAKLKKLYENERKQEPVKITEDDLEGLEDLEELDGLEE